MLNLDGTLCLHFILFNLFRYCPFFIVTFLNVQHRISTAHTKTYVALASGSAWENKMNGVTNPDPRSGKMLHFFVCGTRPIIIGHKYTYFHFNLFYALKGSVRLILTRCPTSSQRPSCRISF